MNQDRVMLLIDADNVSIDVIEQAVPWVHKHYGGPHVRRAYCTAESAVKHQAAFKRLSIRPMVNLAAGKNSTDIALSVDAIDLAVAERPEVMVIASSDSDFAPLVSRLREKGCRVVGIGQNGKTAVETQAMYDDYEVLVHKRKASSTGGDEPPARPAAPKKVAAKKAAARKSASPPAKAPAGDDPAQRLLDALPELADGAELELGVVAERLRKLKLLSKSGSSTKLFGQHPQRFELLPAGKPNRVRLRRIAIA